MGESVELNFGLLVIQICRPRPRDHDPVRPSQRGAAAPKPLANPPLDAIAGHCVPDPSAHRYPEPALANRCLRRENHKTPARLAVPGSANTLKIAPGADSPSTREAFRIVAHLPGVAGTSLCRPLARRRLSTARPARVFIRARKPCLRRRRVRLG